MLVYQDILCGDELLSDSFPYKEIENGMLWEVEGKWVVQGAVDVDIGANPSAEGADYDEGVDDQAVKVVDIVDTFRLQEQPDFDKKQFVTYMKRFIKNLTPKLEGEKAENFKKHIEGATKFLLSNLKDLQFFMGESMHDDGCLVFAYYKDGAVDPTFLYFAYALKEVSNSAVGTSIGPVVSKVERVDSPAKPTPILNGLEPMSRGIEKPRNLEDASDKTKPWELTEIIDPTQCRTVTMLDNLDAASKVARLLYTNSGVGVLALGTNGVQKLWKWSCSEQNPSGKATASIVPQHWQPNSGLLMTNDVPDNSEDAVPCIALSKNDSYVMSACGGKVSLFNMMTFKVMTTFMPPPPASTFLAFHPRDNNIIAIGMEDSAIHIYNVRVDEVKTKLKGHQKRITGLAFSTSLNILVSSGADAQLFFWNTDNWEKIKSVALQLPAGKAPQADTRVQFHSDQVRFLVCHETQLAVYDASKMERMHQWMPQEVLSSPISSAAYSCNSQLVYATFIDGNIGVFDTDILRLRCRIAPSAYISPALPNSQAVHPLVVTAHPQEVNQLAVGLTDGSVKVIEPLEAERKWGLPAPVDNGSENGKMATSSTSNSSKQPQR